MTGDVVYVERGERPRKMIEGRVVLGKMPAQELLHQDGPSRRLHQKTAPPRLEGGVLMPVGWNNDGCERQSEWQTSPERRPRR